MPPALQAYYSDYVTDASGHAVAGATVSLYPVSLFAPGVLPTDVPAQAPLATAVTDATGLFAFKGLPPDDYHILAQYVPAGGGAQTVWRYAVAVAPHEVARRAAVHGMGTALPRTLAKLLGGQPLTICCLGDGVTVGYNAVGTVGGGWVARLASRLAGAFPAAQVLRYDPTSYATSLDAPIPSWTAVSVQAGTGDGPISVINAGVTGDTVLRSLRRLSNVTAASWSPPPDCYLVALGLGEMTSDPTRAAAPSDFAGQLTGLVNLLRASGAEVVLLTPHANSAAPTLDLYAGAVRAVAAASGCGLVDLRELWLDHYDPAAPNDGYGAWLNTAAGDHTNPTDAGHQAMGDEVFKAFDAAGALPVRGPLGVGRAWEQVRLLNTSGLLTFTGGWAPQSGFQLAGLLASGREMQTSAPGDHITFKARFGELYMLCRRWHDGGQVTVTVDGALLGTVDLYRATPTSTSDLADYNGALAPQERVPLALGLSDSVHTVTLQLAATKNAASLGTVWRFDALELLRLRVGGLLVEGTEPLQMVQRGSVQMSLVNASQGIALITFPVPYNGAAPVVVAQSPDPAYYTAVSNVTPTGAQITLVQYAHNLVTDTRMVSWVAFG